MMMSYQHFYKPILIDSLLIKEFVSDTNHKLVITVFFLEFFTIISLDSSVETMTHDINTQICIKLLINYKTKNLQVFDWYHIGFIV